MQFAPILHKIVHKAGVYAVLNQQLSSRPGDPFYALSATFWNFFKNFFIFFSNRGGMFFCDPGFIANIITDFVTDFIPDLY